MQQPTIFVAATRQHVGKTTVSLALMSGLQKRFNKVGFLKPVGQQHLPVRDESGNQLRVDKDVQVMKEYFKLDHVPYSAMSPVIIPSGYTARYIDGEVSNEAQCAAIRRAHETISSGSDVVLAEGTGHVGVGSVVEVSNGHVRDTSVTCPRHVHRQRGGGLQRSRRRDDGSGGRARGQRRHRQGLLEAEYTHTSTPTVRSSCLL